MFSHLIPLTESDESKCKQPIDSYGLGQFDGLPPIPADSSVRVNGMLMDYREPYRERDYLRSIFVTPVGDEFKKQYPGRTLIVGYRPFLNPGELAIWGSSREYYTKALEWVLQPGHAPVESVHIFGERTDSHEFHEWVRARVAPRPLVIWDGVRDIEGTTRHLQYMLRGDDFVLCVSSYHVWGAMLTATADSKVVIDGHPKGWWHESAHVPEQWKRFTEAELAAVVVPK